MGILRVGRHTVIPALLQVRALAPQSVAVPLPSYWLAFDGTDDIITLPSGHGQDPTTALFIEAWVRNIAQEDRNQELVGAGNFFNDGYALTVTRPTTSSADIISLDLNTTTGSYTTGGAFGKTLFDTLPLHLAVGWDGTTIYYFINGVLLGTAAKGGTLQYAGTEWQIGAMPGTLWPFEAQLAVLHISNVCRHTTSFEPPTTFASDANTMGLWLNTDGSGTTLTDSSGNAHHGTFKGAGEPAWGAAADLSVISHGDAVWAACLDVVPAVTGTVYLKRISANEYHLFKQIHADGYWAKWVVQRGAEAALGLTSGYTGQTSTNDPTTWAADPATNLLYLGANEYVFEGKISGGSDIQWGNAHGGEVLDSEGWYVDDTLTTLTNGQYASGAEIQLRATLHFSDGATRVVDVTRSLTLSSAAMYIEGAYQFDWLVDWTPTAQLFPAMCYHNSTNLTHITFEPGGTDYAFASYFAGIRAHGAAAWKADNACILASHVDQWEGVRNVAQKGAFSETYEGKLYYVRPRELGGAAANATWAYTARWLMLDNCGNHFLKTT